MNPYPLKWGFSISCNYSWFLSFARDYPGIDVNILIDEPDAQPPDFTWASHHFRDLADPNEVCIRAAAHKALFDGALLLAQGKDYIPSPLGPLYDLDSNREVTRAVWREPLGLPFSPESPKWRYDRDLIVAAMRSTVHRLLFLTRYDETARHMLQFLGVNGVTWISLYALKDFMKNGGWTESDIAVGAGDTKNNVELFGRTANNHSAIGPFARHGASGWQPPPVPMTLDAAAMLVLKASKAFLNQRAKQIDLDAKIADLS